MSGIFISYSRTDQSFVQMLVETLRSEQRDVWVDLNNIPPSAKWQQEINEAIDSAETMIFVLSPDAIASAAVNTEIQRALVDKKRIIPVVCRDVTPQSVPEALRQLNWIYFRRQDNPTEALQRLRFALDTDLAYWRQAGDLLARARDWEAKGKNLGFILQGAALAEAETWLTEGATKQPSPTPLHLQFIAASRQAAARRQRNTISALTTGLIITLILALLAGYFGLQTQLANVSIRHQNAQLQARQLASTANTLLANGQLEQAMLVSSFAAKQDPQGIPERAALTAALDYSPYLETIIDDASTHKISALQNSPTHVPARGKQVMVSQDGHSALLALDDGFTVYDLTTLKQKFPFVLKSPQQLLGSNDVMSADGKLIINDADSFTIYDAQTGQLLGTLGQNNSDYNASTQLMAISPDSRYFAASQSIAGQDEIVIWNLASKSIVAQITAPIVSSANQSNQIALTFSADSSMLAFAECANTFSQNSSCGSSVVAIWNIAKHMIIAQHSVPTSETDPFSIAFSADNQTLVTGGVPYTCPPIFCNIGQLTIYSAATFKAQRVVTDTDGGINAAAFTPDGNYLITGSGGLDARIWAIHRLSGSVTDPIPFQEVPLYFTAQSGNTGGISSIAPLANNREFLTADSEGKLLRWRLLPFSSQGLSLQDTNVAGDSPVIFAPDGQHVMTGTHDGKILYWDLTTHQIVKTFTGGWASGFLDEHNAFAISPDGTVLADGLNYAPYASNSSGGEGAGGVLLWNLQSGSLVGSALIPPANAIDSIFNNVTNVAFSPDGKYLAQTEFSGRTTIWAVQTRTMVHDFWQGYPATFPNTDPVVSFSIASAFSSKQDVLALQMADNSILLWDVANNKAVKSLSGAPYAITSLDFSPDGSSLLSYAENDKILMWNVQTGNVIHQYSFASPSLLRTQSGLIGLLTFGAASYAHIHATFAPIIVARGPELLLLDPTTLQPSGPPLYDVGDILDSVISADGKYLVTATAQGPITVRSLDPAALNAQVCQIVQRNLTHQEWNDLIGTGFSYRPICPGYSA